MRIKVIIFSVIISILGFLGFYTNSFCADPSYLFGNDVLNGLNGSANINSLLGDTYSFESLYSPVFVVGISNAYDSINDQLYDKFGWDLDDVGNKIIEIGGGDDLGFTLNVLANTVDAPALDILANGYQVFKFVRSGGAESLVLGIADNVNGTIDKIKGNLLNKVTAQDISNMVESIDDEVINGNISDMSSGQVIYGNNIVLTVNGQPTLFTFPSNVLRYGDSSNPNMASAFRIIIPIESGTLDGNYFNFGGTYKVLSTGATYTGGYILRPNTMVYNGKTFVYGACFINQLGAINTTTTLTSQNYTAAQAYQYFYGDVARTYDYSTSAYSRIMALLDQLKGKWVSSSDMATVSDLIMDFPVTPTYDDAQSKVVPLVTPTELDIAALSDLIDSLLDKSEVIALEVDEVLDDSLPDTPDPSPISPNHGIEFPSDYPTDTIDTLGYVITSPFNFFSIFEPLFMLFGSSFSMLFGLWLFFPSFILILFIIWTLK